MKIALATRNLGKVAELLPELEKYNLEVATLVDFPGVDEPEETGATFEENALIKAQALARATGLPAIADDSGLVVEALNGAPGVYSARFADDWQFLPGESMDQRNMRKLLFLMKDIPPKNRSCKFVTVMACVLPSGQKLVTHGEWRGELLTRQQGSNGFGYDPVFFDAALGRSAAQLDRGEKNARSHRGKAARELLAKLPGFLGLTIGNP